jgi:hypothetical protein
MIILTHHTGEPHGILGALMVATFFQRKLSISSIVVWIERDFSKERLLCFMEEYYTGRWSPPGQTVAFYPPLIWGDIPAREAQIVTSEGKGHCLLAPFWQKRYHRAGPGTEKGFPTRFISSLL